MSGVSLIIMLATDYLLGPEAEFLNAWSVVERLIGESPVAGESLVFQHFGFFAEIAGVLLVNMIAGGLLTFLFRLWRGK